MAKHVNSPFGRMKGTVAGQIAYTRLGVDCSRGVPVSYNDANTTLQKVARAKMKALNQLSKAFGKCSLIGLRNTGPGQTEHNLFVRINKDTVMVDTNLSVSINLSQVKAARGSLSKTNGTLTATKAGTSITFNWQRGFDETIWSNKVVVAYRISELAELITETLTAKREDETVIVTIPVATASPVDVWFFFRDISSRNVSDSEYLSVL